MEILKPSAASVQEQLARILASPQFRESPRLQTFLQFVVALTLEGKADQIKESTISTEVFGRADMPDDSIVRSAARRLRTRLEEYYQQAGMGDPLHIVIPKGSYVPEIEERPAPDSLTVADKPGTTDSAAVLVPPDEIVGSADFDEAERPAESSQSRRWWYAAIVLCVAGASLGGWFLRHVSSKPRATPAAKIGRPTSDQSAAHVANPAARDFVMKGRFDMQAANTDGVKRAEADFQHAIDIDPNYAQAYLELAKAKLAKAFARGSIYRTELERDSAEELARKAVQLDPHLAAAHAVLARLAMEYDWDWSRAERELRLASAGPPSAHAELTYAYFLIFQHRFGEAEPHLRRAQELEPFDTSTILQLNQLWYLEGRFAQVREMSKRLLALHPNLLEAQGAVSGSYICEGQPELALATLEEIKKPFPSRPFLEAMARARMGQRQEALRLIRPYEQKYPDTGAALQWIAKVYALLGDEPNTLKWLERSADRREWQALTIAVNPVFAPMENSPGFRALKKRMGLQ